MFSRTAEVPCVLGCAIVAASPSGGVVFCAPVFTDEVSFGHWDFLKNLQSCPYNETGTLRHRFARRANAPVVVVAKRP